MKPLFKWTGSKQRMAKQYADLFYPEKVTRYVDLFCGGLTNLLWVAERYPNAELVINDFNSELILMYRNIKTNTNDVIDVWNQCVQMWLTKTPEERKEYYYELREKYCLTEQDDITYSGLLLFMLQVNFNGMWKAYHKCNNRYSTPPGTCLQKAPFFNETNIREVAQLFQRCEMLNESFENVPLQDGDFVYADPPYRDSVVLYQGGFTEEHQIQLCNLLTSHNGDFAYSNKDIHDGFYSQHFPGCNIYDMTAKYTAGRGTSTLDVSEVLVTNFVPVQKPSQNALETALSAL